MKINILGLIKSKNFWGALAIIILAGMAFFFDEKADNLENELRSIVPDTVMVEIKITEYDTTIKTEVDSVIRWKDIHHHHYDTTIAYPEYPVMMFGALKQPLFDLIVTADVLEETFQYNITYNPLKLFLTIKDPHDLQKNISITTIPPFPVEIDVESRYKTFKPRTWRFALGSAYNRETGVDLLGGVYYKKYTLGITLKNKGGMGGFFTKRF